MNSHLPFKSVLILITLTFSLFAEDDKKEASIEVRLAAAKKVLTESSQITLIYVQGLVCPSCAIGIRKNLSKMDGVDVSRFKQGIDINPETQLVTIALLDDVSLDQKDLIERVEDAGYIAIEEYKLHDGHLDAHRYKHDSSAKIVHYTQD